MDQRGSTPPSRRQDGGVDIYVETSGAPIDEGTNDLQGNSTNPQLYDKRLP